MRYVRKHMCVRGEVHVSPEPVRFEDGKHHAVSQRTGRASTYLAGVPSNISHLPGASRPKIWSANLAVLSSGFPKARAKKSLFDRR